MKLVKYYAWERFFEKHVSLPAADLLSWLGWAACHAVLHTMLLSDQPACLPAHSLFPASPPSLAPCACRWLTCAPASATTCSGTLW